MTLCWMVIKKTYAVVSHYRELSAEEWNRIGIGIYKSRNPSCLKAHPVPDSDGHGNKLTGDWVCCQQVIFKSKVQGSQHEFH